MAQRSVYIPVYQRFPEITCIAQVALWEQGGSSDPWRIWKLIPVQEEDL